MATTVYDVWVLNGQGQRVRETRTVTVSDDQVNEAALRDRALQALAVNAAYLAIASPTNAQVAAQVRRLTQECTALARLVCQALDSTDGS